ncbi:hypothetical protein KTD28_06225 [Burkholderia gladioli]|uniref:hypothetical protein n=1 Tax=Burkholderia gladioli TaxID=28095 RepID=UPI0011B25B16|nr:hypothetical protein [Burkholderia gladioli]MBU9154204.1 hypothetical protein [Burkholderia gladioli]
MADVVMNSMNGRGRELADMLRRELGVPDHVLSFSVHFGIDSLVRVQCEYIPKEKPGNGNG